MDFKISEHIKANYKGEKILNWGTFSRLSAIDVWNNILYEKNLVIDLNDITYLNHDGIIWICFLCLYRSVHENEFTTKIVLPESKKQIATLKLFQLPELQAYLDFRFVNEYYLDYSNTTYNATEEMKLLHKMHFVYANNWDTISNSVLNKLRKYLIDKYYNIDTDQETIELIDPFVFTLNELLHNIVLHSGDQLGQGMGLVSFNPPPMNFSKIRYCCSDAGTGFMETLKHNHSIKTETHTEAIFKALLLRGFDPKKGIVGLYKTLGFIRKKKGELNIISGDALVKIDFNNKNTLEIFDQNYDKPDLGWLNKISEIKNCPYIPGTHICVDLNIENKHVRY